MGQSQGPKIVNGVIIPPLLDLHASEDRREFPTYWMLERYYTGPWTDAELTQQIEPIRVKVAATQDLTGLDAIDEDVIQTLNNIYNSDIDGFTFVRTTFPESGLIT
jgi:hypothetical protein